MQLVIIIVIIIIRMNIVYYLYYCNYNSSNSNSIKRNAPARPDREGALRERKTHSGFYACAKTPQAVNVAANQAHQQFG